MKFVEQFCSFIAQMNRNRHVYFVTIAQKRFYRNFEYDSTELTLSYLQIPRTLVKLTIRLQ